MTVKLSTSINIFKSWKEYHSSRKFYVWNCFANWLLRALSLSFKTFYHSIQNLFFSFTSIFCFYCSFQTFFCKLRLMSLFKKQIQMLISFTCNNITFLVFSLIFFIVNVIVIIKEMTYSTIRLAATCGHLKKYLLVHC